MLLYQPKKPAPKPKPAAKPAESKDDSQVTIIDLSAQSELIWSDLSLLLHELFAAFTACKLSKV